MYSVVRKQPFVWLHSRLHHYLELSRSPDCGGVACFFLFFLGGGGLHYSGLPLQATLGTCQSVLIGGVASLQGWSVEHTVQQSICSKLGYRHYMCIISPFTAQISNPQHTHPCSFFQGELTCPVLGCNLFTGEGGYLPLPPNLWQFM